MPTGNVGQVERKRMRKKTNAYLYVLIALLKLLAAVMMAPLKMSYFETTRRRLYYSVLIKGIWADRKIHFDKMKERRCLDTEE